MSSEDDDGDDDFLVITGAAVADVDGETSAGKQQLSAAVRNVAGDKLNSDKIVFHAI